MSCLETLSRRDDHDDDYDSYIQTQYSFTQQYMKSLLEIHKRKSRHNEFVLACKMAKIFLATV